MPKVSVIIPAYNSAKYICAAIESVLAQSFLDYEIIVVDDGSTDGTGQLVTQRYKNVKYILKPNGGASSARNFGALHSSGELIAFLDSDDAWHSEKLAAQVALMQLYPQACMCRTLLGEKPIADEAKIFTPNEPIPPHFVTNEFAESFRNPYFATSTVMVRKTSFDKVGGFNTSLKIAEDVDFYLRILAQSCILPVVARVALYKRPVPGSLGEDSEAGYIQLLDVYRMFLRQNPEILKKISTKTVRKTYAELWGRYAASLMRDGKRFAAIRFAIKSILIHPSKLAIKVAIRSLVLMLKLK